MKIYAVQVVIVDKKELLCGEAYIGLFATRKAMHKYIDKKLESEIIPSCLLDGMNYNDVYTLRLHEIEYTFPYKFEGWGSVSSMAEYIDRIDNFIEQNKEAK